MKEMLKPPNWSEKLDAASRFVLVLDDEAIYDKETGLVWEKSPDTTRRTWADAILYAYRKTVGGRKGWRLPTVEELASLVDPTQTFPALFLPGGHPFTNVQLDHYWSATIHANNTNFALTVSFQADFVSNDDRGSSDSLHYVWCVRGGYGYDGQELPPIPQI
ncbi:MAG: DUF1566 domain-containing protein [Candidatus Brocadia sp.]|nr:DUF1566 domain-containing protein [Candidatus Brocadia sp.]